MSKTERAIVSPIAFESGVYGPGQEAEAFEAAARYGVDMTDARFAGIVTGDWSTSKPTSTAPAADAPKTDTPKAPKAAPKK